MGHFRMVTVFSVLFATALINMIAAEEPLIRGMKMVSKAHEAVCWYAYKAHTPTKDSNKYLGCTGAVEGAIGNVVGNWDNYFKLYPEQAKSQFSGEVNDAALANLPDIYQTQCKSFLMNANSQPPADESDSLEDGGGDYPYRGFAYCLLKTSRDAYGDQSIKDIKDERKGIYKQKENGMDDAMERGMNMMARAHDAVCWYAYMKNFPNTDIYKYGSCENNVKPEIGNIKMNVEQYFKMFPEKVAPTFSAAIEERALVHLPDVYQTTCKSYLNDTSAQPPADESDALNDGGGDYPYRGYNYCLLKTTRDTFGDKSIEDIKNERTHGKKDWKQVMLDQENLGRARHGVPPLILLDELSEGAQAWAEATAKECHMHHSSNVSVPNNQFKGDSTGENMAEGGGNWDDLDIRGYYAVNGWYNEIRNYTFPDDVKMQHETHLSQSIWKGTKYVGYGMAINKDCLTRDGDGYERYTAARYYPAGNVVGDFENNVFPPKDL